MAAARHAPHSARSLHFGDPNSQQDASKQSNLVRMRSSALGKSAPSLSNHMKESCIARRPSRLHSHAAHHRLSLVVGGTSPLRCNSPLESPRVPIASSGPLHPLHPLHHPPVASATVATRRAKDLLGDGRRWSVASLPSSGYGTTPGSSSLSSQCSSQERLHQLGGAGVGIGGTDDGRTGARRCSPAPPAPTKCAHCSAQAANISGSQGSGINHWQSLSDSGGSGSGGAGTDSPQSPFRRPRSRSLSSPARSPVSGDDQVAAMSALFANRFPKAQKHMEARLKHLAAEPPPRSAPPIVRFVHHQVLEMARDCLHKSETKQITSRYFYDMTENLERLLQETREKSDDTGAVGRVSALVTRLLLAVSRPARLLECLEFDPQQFYRLLEAAEGRARETQGVTADLPQYIIHKLGLSRDPLQEEPPPPPPLPPPTAPLLAHTSPKNKARAGGTSPTENDYQVIKLISNGAYGAVYLVKHTQTRQRFAMKKINKNNLMLRNQVEQVFAERDILSFADNPFVVSMYCSFETRRHLCLVLELVEGGDCASLLRAIGGPLPPDMARFYFAEAVLAVEYLHSYGIVHRDLKPDNLLITALGHIKLTDFGLSKMGLMSLATNLYEEYVDRETQQFSDKQVCGTPEYIAPEVILRQGYGKPVDWWSMGVILYEFLIGCVPFFGETPEELFAHTVNDDIEWPDEDDFPIAPEPRDLITALLARSPRDRLGTGGTHQVKEHVFFYGVDWTSLLRQKAEFVPQLDNDEDTSYFDSRCDRYNHSEADTDCDTGDDSPVLFGTFSSMSPQYRKFQSNSTTDLSFGDGKMMGGSMESCPGTPDSQGEPLIGTVAAPTTPGTPPPTGHHHKCPFHNTGRAPPHSTPESSQTDSDDVSPHLARKRRTNNITTSGGCNPLLSGASSLGVPGSTPKHFGAPKGHRDSSHFSPLVGGSSHHSIIPPPSFSISMEEDVSSIDTNNSSSDTGNTLSTSNVIKKTPVTTNVISTSSNLSNIVITSSAINTTSAITSANTSITSVNNSIESSTSLSQASTTSTTTNAMSGPVPSPVHKHVKKSASASGLSLIIQSDDSFCSVAGAPSPPAGNTSSTNSSRDSSPCREGFAPLSIQSHGLLQMSKPPMVIRRGPKGFGFTIHTIRVYFGESDYYTMHHLVSAVSEGGSAWQAGLRAGDLLVWLNGSWVAGLLHTQVLRLLLASPRQASVRALPLDQTTIQSGGRKRGAWQGRAVGRPTSGMPGSNRRGGATGERRPEPERRRRASLFRRISNKRASAEIQQLVSSGLASPVGGTAPAAPRFGSPPQRMSLGPPPSSLLLSAGLNSAPPSLLVGPGINMTPGSENSTGGIAACPASPASPATERVLLPGEPAPSKVAHHYQRPSTLHGLKHKLGGAGGASGKTTGARRKSAGHIPLSPLARTPSPGPVASSPTRSPSPLALCHHTAGPIGSGNASNPGGNNSPANVVSRGRDHHVRAQGAPRAWPREPASPLLRRALSPDRLHPRSAESKCALISPLCCAQAASSTSNHSRSKGGSALWRPLASAAQTPLQHMDRTPEPPDPNKHTFIGSVQHTLGPSSNSSFAVVIPQQKQAQKQNISQDNQNSSNSDMCHDMQGNLISSQTGNLQSSDLGQFTVIDSSQSRLSLSLNAPVELLPRIAEEKDSPTNSSATQIHEGMDEKKVDQKIKEADKQILIVDQKTLSIVDSVKLPDINKNDKGRQGIFREHQSKCSGSNSSFNSSINSSLNTTQTSETVVSLSSSLNTTGSDISSNISNASLSDSQLSKSSFLNTSKKSSDHSKEHKVVPQNNQPQSSCISKKTLDSKNVIADSNKDHSMVVRKESLSNKEQADIQNLRKAEEKPTMSRSPSLVGQITSKLESLNLKSIQDNERRSPKGHSESQQKFFKGRPETPNTKTAVSETKSPINIASNLNDVSSKNYTTIPKTDISKTNVTNLVLTKEKEISNDSTNINNKANQTVLNIENKDGNLSKMKVSPTTKTVDAKSMTSPAVEKGKTSEKSVEYDSKSSDSKLKSTHEKESKSPPKDKSHKDKIETDKKVDDPPKSATYPIKFEGVTLRNNNAEQKCLSAQIKPEKASTARAPPCDVNAAKDQMKKSETISSAIDRKEQTAKRSDICISSSSVDISGCRPAENYATGPSVSKPKEIVGDVKTITEVTEQKIGSGGKKDLPGFTEKAVKKKK